jgi:hypothetical protein
MHILNRRKKMENEKMMCKVLLDLCAFAYSQSTPDSRSEAIKSYKEAYFMAQKYGLQDIQSFEDLMEQVGRN